jgi:aspartokinase
MKKLSEIVEEEIKRSPFLMESLREGLINISALARKIQKPVEKIIGKGVQTSAIIMSINRLPIQVEQKQEPNLVRFISKLRDVRVRSNIVDYTFVSSGTLIHAQTSLLLRAAELPKSFHSISQGVTETTILVDESLEKDLIHIFRKEKCIERERDLTVLTFLLPAENRVLYGFYYFILREFAWNGINLVEVISTSNEFTLVVSTKDLDAAFKVLSTLRNG